MRYLLLGAVCLLLSGFAGEAVAQSVRRDGYVRRDTGTYVPPSRATRPDTSRLNNYSTRGNFNPHSGRTGTRNPYPAQSYRSGSRRR